MNKNDKLLFDRFASEYFIPSARVLEIGPDTHPSSLRKVITSPVAAWDTLDFHTRTDVPLSYRAEEDYSYPIADASYDIVLSANVIEHVPRIWVWMKELARICRPGGVIVTINPISWHYHEAPIDCWRIYPAGMRAVSEEAGLDVLVSEWGSMDIHWLQRITPGPLRRRYLWQRLSGLLVMWNALTRLPPEGSFDAITVARKPEQG